MKKSESNKSLQTTHGSLSFHFLPPATGLPFPNQTNQEYQRRLDGDGVQTFCAARKYYKQYTRVKA